MKQKQNGFKTVLKLFRFNFISLCGQFKLSFFPSCGDCGIGKAFIGAASSLAFLLQAGRCFKNS